MRRWKVSLFIRRQVIEVDAEDEAQAHERAIEEFDSSIITGKTSIDSLIFDAFVEPVYKLDDVGNEVK